MATAALTGGTPMLGWSPGVSPGLSALAGSLDVTDVNSRKRFSERSISQTSSLMNSGFQRRTLYCNSGYYLQIWPDGTVKGSERGDSRYGILQILTTVTILTNISSAARTRTLSAGINVPKKTIISIRGSETGMWLCMNENGQLYGSIHKSSECDFKKATARKSLAFFSAKYPKNSPKKWYIALDKRTGAALRAMSQIRRTSKFVTYGLRDDTPHISNQPHFNSKTPPRRVHNNKGIKTKKRPHKENSHRRTYSRKGRHRKKSKKRNRVKNMLSALESILLDNSRSIYPSTLFDRSSYNFLKALQKDNVRHSSSKTQSAVYRRRSYTRLQSPSKDTKR